MPNTETNPQASALDQAGSAIGNAPADPNNFGAAAAGQAESAAGVDYKNLYEELEKRFGSQGQELGEYRSFFEGVAPLLDKLDKSPDLVQAIIAGNVDENLAKAVLEGKLNVGEAKVITQAHTEVKKDLGAKGYEKTSVEDISKMVEERVNAVRTELEGQMKDNEEAHAFEQGVNDFIGRTPDFADYSQAIETWFDAHPEVTDIEVAYYAVKGKLSEGDAAKRAEAEQAEHAKNLALNAGGGNGNVTSFPEGVNPIDVLVASRSNPNVF